jgi:CheY-like chemotaxis protein
VAEDDPVSQRVIAGLLDRLGGEVDVVGNGREAIEAIAARHYDIVFMDYRMPEVDGAAAAREIRRREPAGQRTPIVAVTANTRPSDRERCLAAGMDDFLAKPVHSVDLHGAIGRHVDGKRLEVLAPSLAPATGDCPGPVDSGVIERLIAIEAAGVPGFFAELTRDFEQGFHERFQEMRRAVRTCDASLMESAAHSLKGTAALLGASTLSAQCRRLEDLARRGAAGGCAELVASLADEHASVRAVLEAVAASSPDLTPVPAAAGGAPHRPPTLVA